MVATRAAVDRCGFDDVQAPGRRPGEGEGVRGEVHGQVPAEPPSQAAGTQYFAMDADEVPVAGGSRPDRLASVSGLQERFSAAHIVEQIVDSVPGMPVLDAPVPQGKQLADVLMLFDTMVPDVEQVIEVAQDHSGTRSHSAPRFGIRSWRNSWWKCQQHPIFPQADR